MQPKRPTVPSQRRMTFVRNHAKAIIAADFFILATATFRLVYRPHSSLGPGIPDPSVGKTKLQIKRHCIPKDYRIAVTSILGGLHHEYTLERIAA